MFKRSPKERHGYTIQRNNNIGNKKPRMQQACVKRDVGGDKKTAYVPGAKPRVKSEFEKAKLQAINQKKPLKNILI